MGIKGPACAGTAPAAQPDDAFLSEEDIELPSFWEHWFTLRAGAGYRDNVLLSELNQVPRGFAETGLEATVVRLPLDGRQFHWFFDAQDRRYFQSRPVEKEQLLISQAEWQWETSGGWSFRTALEYFYQDQVLDVSASEAEFTTLPVRGHTLNVRPGVTRSLGAQWSLGMDASLGRQWYDEPLDDYSEPAAYVTLLRTYGHKSQVRFESRFVPRLYDTRVQLEANGTPRPGTDLRFYAYEARLQWRHHWEAQRRWRTTTQVRWTRNLDNGGRYYNYTRWQLSQQLQFRSKPWEITAGGRASFYEYDVQPVDDLGQSVRRRKDFTVSLRVEYTLTRTLRTYAEYQWERTLSNLPLEAYTVNTVMSGILLEF